MPMIERFYRVSNEFDGEYCFYVELTGPLSPEKMEHLEWFLRETFEPDKFGRKSFLDSEARVVELGPRLNFETPYSSNAVEICHGSDIEEVIRVERSRRYILPAEANEGQFITDHHDRMTECLYSSPLASFETGIIPEPVHIVPVLEGGIDVLRDLNEEMGLSMDEQDIQLVYEMVLDMGRNPTDMEILQRVIPNTEHARHGFFKARQVIDGVEMPRTLMELVQAPHKANPSNSVLSFEDNSSAIKGYKVKMLVPENPSKPSSYFLDERFMHWAFTAETHNFPSGIAPVPGAETGTGGRIRDIQATGRGALMISGTAGYCVGSLLIPDHSIPGENPDFTYPSNLASPKEILIGASDGASDYGNCIGEPVIQGFARSFDMELPNGERRGWIKPIMFTGGLGQIDDRHIRKGRPEKGMVICMIGGPAYRIGFGGGAASSMIQGANREDLDLNAVQRGDPETEQKMNRIIRWAVFKGHANPVVAIHDQGAGGPSNVLVEIVDPVGGHIELRNIKVGDKTMSALEIWAAEYQERNAILLRPEALPELKEVCERENVSLEVLGEITGDGRFVVHDANDDSTPIDLELSKVLGAVSQKTFKSEHMDKGLVPLLLPDNLTLVDAIRETFMLISVGSKDYLVNKGDRTVTGLIAQQQCCGPIQLPVSDVAVVAQSFVGYTGAAKSLGEKPIEMLISPAAGTRMAVAEAMTNLMAARISSVEDVKFSANWMWAYKLPGEGAEIYGAAAAFDFIERLAVAVDGGKDSGSMAAKHHDRIVKAPGDLVISAYVTTPDVRKVLTPDLKWPGKSKLMLIYVSEKNRLGGSALAQANMQIGDECPDIDDRDLFLRELDVMFPIHDQGLASSYHDRSDGGLITTITEMLIPCSSCGVEIHVPEETELFSYFLAHEAGMVIEYLPEDEERINSLLHERAIPFTVLGDTTFDSANPMLRIYRGDVLELEVPVATLRDWWEATSDRLEEYQTGPTLAREQAKRHNRPGPSYHLSFEPNKTPQGLLLKAEKPKVAILREEGINGDWELAAAFFLAGFDVKDVAMSDLEKDQSLLDPCRVLAMPGGFSFKDVFDAAKGQAGKIRFNPKLREIFRKFYERLDTLTLGICNSCQLQMMIEQVPYTGLPDIKQPRFIKNLSGKFESRFVTVKILPSPAIMLQGMEDSTLGIMVAHGEGRSYWPDESLLEKAKAHDLLPMRYVDDYGQITLDYPFNPNGSVEGIAAVCSQDGRHLAMMPHPERLFLKWQWPYWPQKWSTLKTSPWLKLFQNAREWCEDN